MAAKTSDETAFLGQLGVRVRRARARAGLTRRRLAQASGVSERYLAQLESGEGNISILLIRRVAAALGTDINEIIGEPVDLARHRRVALIGVRGVGKSTLGARLAERIDAPFIELDGEIERELAVPLASVFAQKGQEGYREAERRVLQRVIDADERCVLAVGGSLVLEPPTYQLLRSRCFTVWLKASAEDHIARLVAQGDLRPMQGSEHPLLELRTILAQRERLYSLADVAIDTGVHDEDECLERLVAAIAPPADDPPLEVGIVPS